MTTAITLQNDLEQVLKTLPDVGARIYVNGVPDKIPEAYGFIRPYVALWTGLPTDIVAERDLRGLYDRRTIDWRPTTTCVGPDANTCLALADQVSALLINLPLAGGWLVPDNEPLRFERPQRDTTITPSRMFMPLPWRLVTTI